MDTDEIKLTASMLVGEAPLLERVRVPADSATEGLVLRCETCDANEVDVYAPKPVVAVRLYASLDILDAEAVEKAINGFFADLVRIDPRVCLARMRETGRLVVVCTARKVYEGIMSVFQEHDTVRVPVQGLALELHEKSFLPPGDEVLPSAPETEEERAACDAIQEKVNACMGEWLDSNPAIDACMCAVAVKNEQRTPACIVFARCPPTATVIGGSDWPEVDFPVEVSHARMESLAFMPPPMGPVRTRLARLLRDMERPRDKENACVHLCLIACIVVFLVAVVQLPMWFILL